LDVAGSDATEAFEDVGHSDEAREILEGLLVGTIGREFAWKEVAEHNTKRDLWIVVRNKVYDCTSFIDEHPYVNQSLSMNSIMFLTKC
jgi:cytochrome b involved in lipid metabolism